MKTILMIHMNQYQNPPVAAKKQIRLPRQSAPTLRGGAKYSMLLLNPMTTPMSNPPVDRDQFVKALLNNVLAERRNAEIYDYLASLERDPHRSAVLKRMADAEAKHAAIWTRKLKDLGVEPPPAAAGHCSIWRKWLYRQLGVDAVVRRMEQEEEVGIAVQLAELKSLGDDQTKQIAEEIAEEESSHGRILNAMLQAPPSPTDPRGRLSILIKHERHHATGGWLGSAIYGINDGLGAVFGIVSGMAGYGAQSSIVLASGLAGMIASALSMGSGAWLAAKSQREAFEAEVTRERREIEMNPAEEREELELMYQLKGFSEEEAKMLAKRMAENPEHLLETKLHEELGLSEGSFPNPWLSAISAAVSTMIGAFIPVIPFFFTSGMTAVVWSLGISIAAHFIVGAAKTLVTGLNWFKSGMEMTIVSIIAAAVTYGFGYFFAGHGQAVGR
ncbi:MAG: VIT1/CCC1 transporter family protein [Verrucomicrobiia bacterium]